jgi:hypothetical protein
MQLRELEHAEGCLGLDDDGNCETGAWPQPPGTYVETAIEQLPEGAPWCVIQRRAWLLVSNDVGHAEDCGGLDDDGECQPIGDLRWNQPNGGFVQEAKGDLPNLAPWCLIHHRAWELQTAAGEG